MYCQFGDIAFQRREYFAALEQTLRWDFAEHAHAAGRPGLEAVGRGLDTIALDMAFHHMWCEPAVAIDKLIEQADRASAQGLVFGDGTYLGQWVVTELTKTWQHTDPDGQVLYAVVRAQLKQFIDHEPLETSRKRAVAAAPAVKVPPTPKPAAVKRSAAPRAAAATSAAAKPATVAKPGVQVKTGVPSFQRQQPGELFSNVPIGEVTRA